MLKNSIQQGHSTGKVFLTKRMECSILLFASAYIICATVPFIWFYSSKTDAMNFDAYDILDDALQANSFTSVDNDVYEKDLLNFTVNDIRCNSQNFHVRIKPGLIYDKDFDRAFMIRRVRHDGDIKYYNCRTAQNNQPINITAIHTEYSPFHLPHFIGNISRSFSQNFSFLNEYSFYDQSSGNLARRFISAIHITYYSFRTDDGEIIEGFSSDTIIDYSEQYSNIINIYIQCANELLPYDLPVLDNILVMAISFILFLLSGILIFVFLWHCWSYKFVLVKRAIIESGVHFER